ncbi:3-keto-disaccharide hydrolase [Undibacterium sp. Ji42W]|uniref:3-keto-disaccharide hydrolase n=1 Tax=Undibacterium sp. Ji42W TaxID=3413039 RepID=UPI003BF301AD
MSRFCYRINPFRRAVGAAFVSIFAIASQAAIAGDLFNGRDFQGWEIVSAPSSAIGEVFSIKPDGVIASAGKPSGYIATKQIYKNFILHAEWRWVAVPGNSGVLIHISSGPKDKVWPLSLQIQTKHKNVGDLLPMAGASFAEPLTTAEGAYPLIKAKMADSEKPVGEWNSCDILAKDGMVEVSINGIVQNKISKASPDSGQIGFQLEGTAYELRNVRVQKLD